MPTDAPHAYEHDRDCLHRPAARRKGRSQYRAGRRLPRACPRPRGPDSSGLPQGRGKEITRQAAEPLQCFEPIQHSEARAKRLEAGEVVSNENRAGRKACARGFEPDASRTIGNDDMFMTHPVPPNGRLHREAQKIQRIRAAFGGSDRPHRQDSKVAGRRPEHRAQRVRVAARLDKIGLPISRAARVPSREGASGREDRREARVQRRWERRSGPPLDAGAQTARRARHGRPNNASSRHRRRGVALSRLWVANHPWHVLLSLGGDRKTKP